MAKTDDVPYRAPDGVQAEDDRRSMDRLNLRITRCRNLAEQTTSQQAQLDHIKNVLVTAGIWYDPP